MTERREPYFAPQAPYWIEVLLPRVDFIRYLEIQECARLLARCTLASWHPRREEALQRARELHLIG